LHAPSNTVSKGTTIIIDILTNLQKKGYKIEIVKLENVPNNRVMEELVKCHLVVDEVYSDTSLGALGTEAAFAKKPVINGGFYSVNISDNYPGQILPPAIFCLPEEIEDRIVELLNNADKHNESGLSLYNFVMENWDSYLVAQRYMLIFNNKYPKQWLFDPKDIDYFFGYGIAKDKLQLFLKQYLHQHGEKALFLDDKPELKKKLMHFINNTSVI
jgi:hypothetical protein